MEEPRPTSKTPKTHHQQKETAAADLIEMNVE